MPSQHERWDWQGLRHCCLREARRVLGNDPQAEDAAQEALIRAWRHRSRCRAGERPESWVGRIARNEALRLVARPPPEPCDERECKGPVGSPLDVDRLAGAVDLRRALNRLSADERHLLVLRYVADLTQPEVAKRTGVAEGTAKVRLHRARKRLRDTLEGYDDG